MIANARLLKRSLVCLRLTQALARLPAKAGYSKCARALPTGSLFSAATPAFAFGKAYPKHTLVSLPVLSPTMTEGRIAAWHIKVGQKISEGDNIFDVQTDKDSVPNIYQEEAGYVAALLVKEGELIATNTTVVVVVRKESDIAAFADYTAASAAAPSASPAPAKEEQKVKPAEPKATATATNQYQESNGFVAAIFVKEGELVPTNHPVCIITTKKDDVAKFAAFTINDINAKPATASPAAAKQSVEASTSSPTSSASTCSSSSDRVIASPFAKKIASENNLNLSGVKGSGPSGRIIGKDVRDAVHAQAVATPDLKVEVAVKQQAVETSAPKKAPQAAVAPPAAATVTTASYERLAITPMRRVIAERLVLSKTTIPHFYLTVDIQMDEVLSLRKVLNESSASKISVNDLVVKASALALRDLPGVNSQWHGDHIRQFKNADVAVAVSTKTGLITPIVFAAETLGLAGISTKTKELAEKARSSTLAPNEYQGGTFTISNLGMYGVDSFSAIVNPPHGTILAVGATSPKVVPDSNPSAQYPFKTIQSMSVTLSCDHRVVDGALGAQWLQKFKSYLEKPLTMLL